MRQRAIRFPDDLDAAIEAEARRLGHPHTFSSVIVNAARRALLEQYRDGFVPREIPVGPQRGSPSPSLERAKRSIT